MEIDSNWAHFILPYRYLSSMFTPDTMLGDAAHRELFKQDSKKENLNQSQEHPLQHSAQNS